MKNTIQFLAWFCVSIFFFGCQPANENNDDQMTITVLNCEEVDGEFICNPSEGTGEAENITDWCVYASLGCRGNDCPTPDPDFICVKCPTNKQCPQKISLLVKGKDARFRVKLTKAECINCPRDGYKAEFVGF